MTMPRSEYPRPQFVRKDWLCLNGQWQFEIDPGDSGLERGLKERPLSGRINRALLPRIRPLRRGPYRFYRGGLVSPRGDYPGGLGGSKDDPPLPGRGLRRHRMGKRPGGGGAIAAASALSAATSAAWSRRARRRSSFCARAIPRMNPAPPESNPTIATTTPVADIPAPPASGRPSGWSRCRSITCAGLA